MTEQAQLSTHRKRRGIVRASLTRLRTRLTELEDITDQLSTLNAAKQLLLKLESLDTDFKTHHLAIVDLTEGDDPLALEQDVLDKHDDDVAQISLRAHQVISACQPATDTGPRRVPYKRLSHLQAALTSIRADMASPPSGPDGLVLLRQFEEQLSEFKQELTDVRSELYSLDLEDSDELIQLQAAVEKIVFDCSLEVKKLLLTRAPPTSSVDPKGVKLPKIDVPTFDGNLLHWTTFWEQFDVAVHSKSSLTDTEKLVYLQHALKGGSARQAIEGLSRSGDYYAEAIECLKD